MNYSKSSILGIFFGVIIIIFSIVIFSYDARFGGDFYTEIFKLCRLGYGFLILSIGLTDICYFALHLQSKPNNQPSTGIQPEDNSDLPDI